MRLQIGNATLYLAQCEQILPFIGPVDCLCVDPPYLFETSGGGTMRKARHTMEDIEANEMNKGFNIDLIDFSLYRSIFMFCHNDQLHTILPHLAARYARHAVLCWQKSNPMPVANKHYVPEFEPYIHAWNKDGHPVGDLADKKRIVTTAVGKSPFDHPTVKPDAVMDKIMRNVNGATVLDCFMGTGSTGIAALKHGKKFIGIERKPKFFNIAVARLTAHYAGMAAPVSI